MPAQVCPGVVGLPGEKTGNMGQEKGNQEREMKGSGSDLVEMSTGLIPGLLPLGWGWLWPEEGA